MADYKYDWERRHAETMRQMFVEGKVGAKGAAVHEHLLPEDFRARKQREEAEGETSG